MPRSEASHCRISTSVTLSGPGKRGRSFRCSTRAGRTAWASLLGKAQQRFRLKDHHSARLDRDHSFRLPSVELLVQGLARGAKQRGERLLRDRELDAGAGWTVTFIAFPELEQRLGKPARQVPQRAFGEKSAGSPEAIGRHRQQAERQPGLPLQKRNEVSSVEKHELARRKRNGIGAARLLVENGHLADDLSRTEDREHRLLAVETGHADLHLSRGDHHHAFSRLAFSEYHFAGTIPPGDHQAGHVVEL